MFSVAEIFTVVVVGTLITGINGERRYFEGAPDYDDGKYDFEASRYDISNDEEVTLPVKSEKLQKFMDALIMEAGRHALYPSKEPPIFESSSSNSAPNDRWKGEGQQEYIDLGMKRDIVNQVPECPDDCPDYHPVCGNDGKVYNSECHLLKLNCGQANVTVDNWELCRGKHFLCPSKCLDINDPVCGQDGRMYHNICVMRKRNCGQFLQTRPIKFCYVRETTPTDACPVDCQEIYKPVCGSDGAVYYNDCFLRMRNCGANVRQVDMEYCTHTSECPERCVAIYDPVCGSDGKMYTNLCRMLQGNCGINIKRMPRHFCSSQG